MPKTLKSQNPLQSLDVSIIAKSGACSIKGMLFLSDNLAILHFCSFAQNDCPDLRSCSKNVMSLAFCAGNAYTCFIRKKKKWKARARAQLGGCIFQNFWMMGLAVCLLIELMESAAAAILPAFGLLIVGGPLEYGMAYIFLKQARDR